MEHYNKHGKNKEFIEVCVWCEREVNVWVWCAVGWITVWVRIRGSVNASTCHKSVNVETMWGTRHVFCLHKTGLRCLMYIASRMSWWNLERPRVRILKDRLPTTSISNLIYLFECRQCKSQYVGKTSQRLGDRVKQHVPRRLVDSGTEQKRGWPPKKRANPKSDYQSAIACHLASKKPCLEKVFGVWVL